MSYRMTLGILLLAIGLGGVVAAQPPARSAHAQSAAQAAGHGGPGGKHPMVQAASPR